MPNANEPKAPWVAVWLSPQAMVMPGSWVRPSSGTDDVDDALTPRSEIEEVDAEVTARISLDGLHHHLGLTRR